MKKRYIGLFGAILGALGIVSVLYVKEVDLHYQFLGMGRWVSFSGYFSPYAGFGIAAISVGIALVLLSVLSEVCRNNTHQASI